MYPNLNLSCRISNETAIDYLLGAMETDFLNFHDEEHFGTALYQNDLLEDSQSSLLDIVGDSYHRQDSGEYGDHSVIWEQDVERELNGDVAVIPMSGQINTFPKLSNSPPSKDFTKIFSDWQHLTAIESAPTEDLAVDLHLPSQGLVVDMMDCFTPTVIAPVLPTVPEIETKLTPSSIVSSFDFSTTEVPKIETNKIKIEPKVPVRKIGGKNLELLKKVIKEDNDLESSFKSEILSSDELDSVIDNFDITSYVNGDDELMLQNEDSKEEKIVSSIVPTKQEKRKYRPYGGCYEKNMPNDDEVSQDKEEIIKIKKEDKEDSEEDCIDVETVTEQIPVLEARDLNSLLEQFEASEAVNPKLPQNLFEEKPKPSHSCQLNTTDNKSTSSLDLTKKNEPKKIKQLNSELKQPTTKQTTVSIELLQKIRASSTRKPVSVIPARPSKKIRAAKTQDPKLKIPKTTPSPQNQNESYQHDHDYCSPRAKQNVPGIDSDTTPKKINSLDCDKTEYLQKSDTNIDENKCKKNLGNIIDDTAIRIGKQIKNAINNENALKQKLKNQPIIKSDGKLMISLLKTNNRNNLINKINKNTVINTINTNDEQIKNIIVNDTNERNSKKRKLNLEEYKKLRGDIIKTSTETSCQNSPQNSGNNSPMQHNDKIKVEYQERIMKMASEILKTNAKQKQNTCETKLEAFVPPEEKLNSPRIEPPAKIEIEVKKDKVVPKMKENYEMKTIVSIGVNTDESLIKTKNTEPKITFKLAKKKEITRNKFFDSKSSESEENSPKKEVKSKLSEIITPILQNASCKINSNSLITNITATLLQQSPRLSPKSSPKDTSKPEVKTESTKLKNEPLEHGEDKTVIILNKNDHKPEVRTIGIQTDVIEKEEKIVRNYRPRRDSSASSSTSVSSLKSKTSSANIKKTTSQRQSSLRNSSSNSVSSSLGSRWSRSRSRSRSRSLSRSSSHSEYSSYSSDSSRSKSRSISPRRWHTDRNSRSRHRYNRSRRRSSSRSRSNSYRGNYRHSRSPYSRSRSRRRRDKQSAEREKMREVEERRVIYVGKISEDTTRADLRRRFQNFGPITNVSVHFRDHGDNYGFVTFAYKMDAYEAVERGNDDPNQPKYDISFGGRRAFCKTRYSDLDNIEAEQMNPAPIFRRDEDSFDILLREVQAKLRKRKV